mmetsp:Transcript_32342/g.102609  ORF Transcript_32342/g.102609 Transcript_32342/m.102609 type:complete len:207 (-) Transcript_32342:1739-2359(-)
MVSQLALHLNSSFDLECTACNRDAASQVGLKGLHCSDPRLWEAECLAESLGCAVTVAAPRARSQHHHLQCDARCLRDGRAVASSLARVAVHAAAARAALLHRRLGRRRAAGLDLIQHDTRRLRSRLCMGTRSRRSSPDATRRSRIRSSWHRGRIQQHRQRMRQGRALVRGLGGLPQRAGHERAARFGRADDRSEHLLQEPTMGRGL